MESKKSSFSIFSTTERAKEKIRSFDGCLSFRKRYNTFWEDLFFRENIKKFNRFENLGGLGCSCYFHEVSQTNLKRRKNVVKTS